MTALARLTALLILAAAAQAVASPTFSLLDNRGWEMVSPLDKNGGGIQGFGGNFDGGLLQASSDGNSVTYSSSDSFGAEAQGAPAASQYLSRRSEGGWSTENITTPTLSGSYGDEPNGVPYQLFSTDLARGLLLNGERCVEGEPCLHSYSLRESATGTLTPSPEEPDLRFAGASPDLRHVVLSTCAALTPEATEVPNGEGGCEAADTNLYEWSEGQLALINVLPGQAHGTPGAVLAAQSGAISSDGRRAYFTELEDGPLYLAEEGEPTRLLPETVGGGASFQTASSDGAVAFFIKGGRLYRYDATTEASEPLATEVLGVLGASEDGSYLYYATAAGIFLWHAGTTTPAIAFPAAADPGDYPPATGTARVSPDGRHLAFLSKAPLSGYDNADQQTGEPDSELFLYTAPEEGGEGTLTCASCNPTGARPLGPSTIPGASANGKGEGATDSYKPRDLSEDGTRLFFDSSDSLVVGDTDAAPDVYEWEAQGGACQKPLGCIGLISSARSSEGSSFVDASTSGSDAFFLTGASLVPSDPGSFDLYDAREGGGFPVPPNPIECGGDACQPLPSGPEDPTPGTLLPRAGNPALQFPKPGCPKGTHRARRHGKPRCVGNHHRKHRGRR